MRRYATMVLAMMVMLMSASCEWDDVDETNAKYQNQDTPGEEVVVEKLPALKVAVVLPLDNSYRPRFERVAQWAIENIAEATRNHSFPPVPDDLDGLTIEIEWHDENSLDTDQDTRDLARQLANSKDIMCIIGPMYSSNAMYFGLECAKTGMNILLPCTTSAEVVRKFSSKPFFWSFAETDVRQCQVILETAKQHLGANSVTLLAGNSFYGQTFVNWLPFQARENGLELDRIYTFDGDLSQELASRVLAESKENQVIVCVPGDTPDITKIQDAVLSTEHLGKVLFSDIAMDPSLLDLMGNKFENASGIGITADQESDFLNDYISKYGQEPTEGECQFYDALVLMSIVASDLFSQNLNVPEVENYKHFSDASFYNKKVSDALTRILKPASNLNEMFLTKPDDISALISTKMYNLRGASGHIDFDKNHKSSVAHSTYQYWTIKDGKFLTLQTYQESTMSTDAWENAAASVDKIEAADVDIEYPEHEGNWALLLAGSNSWGDYRHQANVLKMYRLLKDKGYPDDHIVLIMEDNIVNDGSNIHSGQLVDASGSNLFEDVEVDYNITKVSAADISAILHGWQSSKISKVINAGPNDNILVYWTGNGSQGQLSMASQQFSNSDFQRLISGMASGSDRKYRKMLWIVDASNAQSVTSIDAASSIPGVLCINSSLARETSLADQTDFDEAMDTYLSTHFTSVLVDELGKSSSLSINSLYERLAVKTSGSHVNVSNAARFDNLSTATLGEFVQYKK